MEEFKYCPVCGAEYDANIEKCADCFVGLVSARELEQMKESHQKGLAQTVIHITPDGEEAARLVGELQGTGLDASLEKIDAKAAGISFTRSRLYHVLVLADEEDRARFFMQQFLAGLPRRQDNPATREEQEITARLQAAVEAGEEGMYALPEFFGEHEKLHRIAMKAAVDLGEPGESVLMEWVKKTCTEEEMGPLELHAVADACGLLADSDPEWAVVELARELLSGDWWVRKNFCFALGRLASELAIPYLVTELRDPDPAVRNEAIDQLYNFEHTDHGFDPDLEPEQQPEALAKWQKLASRYK